MTIGNRDENKSAHRLAFEHYLRTGERLINAEWLKRPEHKFNPYHDERGRFTSPPGVIVSWGRYGPPSAQGAGRRARSASATPGISRTTADLRRLQQADISASVERGKPVERRRSRNGFQSELVRNAVREKGHAETYFELNKRQAGLNRLRSAAGRKPGSIVAAFRKNGPER